ncbi:hypothetical protein V8F20_002689 [Naviculisporaceae sp. PSN 640]
MENNSHSTRVTPCANGSGNCPAETNAIAICGLALRLPGSIRSPSDYWNLLSKGLDARGPMSARRRLHPSQDAAPPVGYFLDEEIGALDTSFFSVTKNELNGMDPQQRILLEMVKECFDDAAEPHHRGKKIGCFVGTFGDDWVLMCGGANDKGEDRDTPNATNLGDLMLANRVSYEYDLVGPSMVIKTGCSASMVALHQACRAIQSGDANGAIVAGTSLIMTSQLTAAMDTGNVLSQDCSCKTFDAAADGYGRAEGVTAIYIKRLEDAVRDGNPIRAVIRGTASNCDGRGGEGGSLAMPSCLAHEALMKMAYKDAGGLDPGMTAFVECHGTGTPTGDPIETGAVGRMFGGREGGILIGSVKPNVGHSEGASGVSGIIKAVLALERRTIPPSIKFNKPNPGIGFDKYGLKVPLVPTPFPEGRAERISVNSFGIGGANAHVILDSYHQYCGTRAEIHDIELTTRDSLNRQNGELLLFSANTETSLREQVGQYKTYLQRQEIDTTRHMDISYTLAMRRQHLPHRAFSIVLPSGELLEDLTAGASSGLRTSSVPPPLVMVFSGQGAQWAQMGRDLTHDPDFLADLTEMNGVLHSLAQPPSWDLVEELLKSAETSQISKAELAQPLCTALQVALIKRYHALGVDADFVVGHSSGEIAAAFAAGFLSMEEAIVIAYYRGYVTSKTKESGGPDGAMAAIGLSKEEVGKYLDGYASQVLIACENSPASLTVSGDKEKVEEVVEAIRRDSPDTLARMLKVDMAYHSHHMKHLSAEYQCLLESELPKHLAVTALDSGPKPAQFYSSVTGEQVLRDGVDDPFGPKYWVQNLTSPVLFSTAMSNLSTSAISINSKSQSLTVLEIGPHSTLAGPIRQILQTSSPCSSKVTNYNYIPSQLRNTNSRHAFLSSIGSLYQTGMPLNFTYLFPHQQPRAVSDLPPYSFDHTTIRVHDWFLSNLRGNNKRQHALPPAKTFPKHFLLGKRISSSPDMAPQWRNILRIKDQPWLADHMIQQDVVFPFVGYVTMAGEAVRQITGGQAAVQGYKLRHVVAHSALLLPQDTNSSCPVSDDDNDMERNSLSPGVRVMTLLRRHKLNDAVDSPEWFEFTIMSCPHEGSSSASWTKHCDGQVAVIPVSPSTDSSSDAMTDRQVKWTPEALPRQVDTARLYNAMSEVRQSLDTPREVRQPDGVLPHPATMDACLQLLLGAKSRGLLGRRRSGLGHTSLQLAVPSMIESLVVLPVSLAAQAPVEFPEQSWETSDSSSRSETQNAIKTPTIPESPASSSPESIQCDFLDIDFDVKAYPQFHYDRTKPGPLMVECATSHGELVLRASGIQLKPIADSDQDVVDETSSTWYNDVHAAARLTWLPDFDFLYEQDPSAVLRAMPDSVSSDAKKQNDLDKDILCLKLQEELTFLCIVESARQIKELTPCKPHWGRFREWLNQQVTSENGTKDLVAPQAKQKFLSLSSHECRTEISRRFAPNHATMRILIALPGLFTGTADTDTISLLLQDNLLPRIYDSVTSSIDYDPFMRLLSHSRPMLRILEVGAGTGRTTEAVLRALSCSPSGETNALPRYNVYTFTDLSAGFFPAAKERFARYVNPAAVSGTGLEYRVLDISRPPEEQGFNIDDESTKYDLIIAANVIHATPSLKDTLGNIRKLLKTRPGEEGMLLMTEVIDTGVAYRSAGYVFGCFDGWWLGEADGRADKPYVGMERWDTELREAGFRGVDGVVWNWDVEDNATEGQGQLEFGVSKTGEKKKELPAERQVVLLTSKPEVGIARDLGCHFQSKGWSVCCADLANTQHRHSALADDRNIISVLDMETAPTGFFESIDESGFSSFQTFLRSLSATQNVLWLLPPSQMDCNNPCAAHTIGLARTIRSELALRFCTLEIDPLKESPGNFCCLIERVFGRVLSSALLEQSDLSPYSLETDKEFAVHNGVIHIGRYEPFSLPHEVADRSTTAAVDTCIPQKNQSEPDSYATVLDLAKPGRLETLQWRLVQRPSTLPPDHVEISVRAVGVNFSDVVYATGVLPSEYRDGRLPLGMEVSGVIVRSSCPEKFPPGDHVLAFQHGGGFTSHLLASCSRVLKLAPELASRWTHTEAATIQCVYATALYALLDVGNLQQLVKGPKSPTILIHSACGGVGLAALQICRNLLSLSPSRIFCTIGGATANLKADYLMTRYSIPRQNIFSSRNAHDFYNGILALTGGYGVDLVLNSLLGEMLAASWKLVAPNGKLLELGKRDLNAFGKLDMRGFLENKSYCGVDVAYLARERPDIVRDVLQRTLDFCAEEKLGPIENVIEFDGLSAREIGRAFRLLQKGEHIGKIVVNLAGAAEDEGGIGGLGKMDPVVSCVKGLEFKSDATYLLVGGVGGLGRSIAVWMAERGARYLMFLSPSAGVSEASRDLARELESMGCAVNMVSGSVTNPEDIDRAIDAAALPILGVFQLAMAQRDSQIINMSWPDWRDGCEPKVTGTWNLHNAFIKEQDSHALEFFWLASSALTVVDQVGQGNYKAACTFLESFVQYRHSLGLPASVLSICPIEDVGFVADNDYARRNCISMGLYLLSEREFLEAVEASLLVQNPLPSGRGGNGWQSTGHIIMGLRSSSKLPLDDHRNPTNWRRDRRMGFYHNVCPPTTESTVDNDGLASSDHRSSVKAFIAKLVEQYKSPVEQRDLDPDLEKEAAEFLALSTARKVNEFLLRPESGDTSVDMSLSLSQIGLDSLTAIEMRRWFRQAMGLQVSVLEMMSGASLAALGESLVARLKDKFVAGNAT